MEIYHKVAINADHSPEFYARIKHLGIEHKISPLPGQKTGGVTFRIPESDPNWAEVQRLIDVYGAFDIIGTVFSTEEMIDSEWNRLVPLHEWGYPQPENKMRWVEATYQDVCQKCGVCYTQKAPFRLKKEPRLGKNHFFTLIWDYVLFCRFDVLEAFRENKITGYDTWDAILHSANQPSSTVTQLAFPVITQPGLFDEDKKRPEKCAECGITKYAHHRRGKLRYKRDALQDSDFQLINEWFGSGGYSGFREILVSNRLTRLIISKGWRGITLRPIELV